jgi:hypothetical protein
LLRGGKSGPAIVLGKPDESLVVQKIRSGEMPPITRLIEVSIKPIEPAETDVLVNWIARGAPAGDIVPDVASTNADPLVSERDRDFWSFRSPRAVEPPTVQHSHRVRNPVDAFVLAELEKRGLRLSPEANRTVLLRRVTFDLTGLPPEPAEIDAFLKDDRTDAYERVVARLLDSTRYGERWARHWLDVVGYSDSEGKREQDVSRSSAWRYRDYVIRALNADKPYDRFLLEQIAGDELADYEHAPEITEEMYWNLVATGFLRMAPDPTWYNLTNFVPDRLDVMADEIDVFSSTVLGMTMKCARCHSHKFDPIPHRDYYRLVDIFKGAFDEHDWMKSNWFNGLSMGERSDRDLPFVSTRERREWEAHNAKLQREITLQQAAFEDRLLAAGKKMESDRLAGLPETIRGDVWTALETPVDRQNTVQKYLAEKFEKTVRIGREELLKADTALKQLADESAKRVAELESQKLPEPKIRALWDRGDPSPTYIYRRGDYLNPARLVGPGVPSVLTDGKTPFEVVPPWPGSQKTGRRLALARWLTRPDHPLTARVMVNRIWRNHFGQGIVKTLDNFGKTGAPPTHPDLLDWLARRFIDSGWSIKEMHRLLVTSATYRQSSHVTSALEAADPDNVWYGRMALERLSADQLYDSLLFVSGQLDNAQFGPADAVDVRGDGLATPRRTPRGWRRSVYVQQQRKIVVTALENFDFPLMNPNCSDRRESTVVLQALHLMNNGMVSELADALARRVETEAVGDAARQIERIYLLAFSRKPDAEELSLGQSTIAKFVDRWLQANPTSGGDRNEAAHKALATYCHAILNSGEFLYVD